MNELLNEFIQLYETSREQQSAEFNELALKAKKMLKHSSVLPEFNQTKDISTIHARITLTFDNNDVYTLSRYNTFPKSFIKRDMIKHVLSDINNQLLNKEPSLWIGCRCWFWNDQDNSLIDVLQKIEFQQNDKIYIDSTGRKFKHCTLL